MSYIIKILTDISYFESRYMINGRVMLLSLLIVLVFNIVVGLLPVFNTIRKTPAQILSRHDLE